MNTTTQQPEPVMYHCATPDCTTPPASYTGTNTHVCNIAPHPDPTIRRHNEEAKRDQAARRPRDEIVPTPCPNCGKSTVPGGSHWCAIGDNTDPAAMAARGASLADLTKALKAAGFQVTPPA